MERLSLHIEDGNIKFAFMSFIADMPSFLEKNMGSYTPHTPCNFGLSESIKSMLSGFPKSVERQWQT